MAKQNRRRVERTDGSARPRLEHLAPLILLIRGEKVLLDSALALLYGVEARALNQAVARNRRRFPRDFMFQLSGHEYASLRTHSANSSQTVMSSRKHRGRSYRPYAFTEQGVAMLSSVLRSVRAIEVNIAIMRAFVQLRRLMHSNHDLARKLLALERKCDERFVAVFDAIRRLAADRAPSRPAPKRLIGFRRESQPASPASRAGTRS